MPKQYTAMRDKLHKEGMPIGEAKTRAAKMYNAKHPSKPVTKEYEEAHKFKKYVKKQGG